MPQPEKRTAHPGSKAVALRPTWRRWSEMEIRHPAAAPCKDFDVQTSHGRIAVRARQGHGLPVILLHGNSADKDVFVHQMAADLDVRCRMIALDLPGHGRSSDAADPDRTYTIPGYADAVIEVLEKLDLPHVALVGWSLGGHIALEIAARYPGVVGVLLCGTPPVGTSPADIMAGFSTAPDLRLAGQAVLAPAEVRALRKLVVGEGEASGVETAITRTDGRARATMFTHLFQGGVPDQRAFVESTTIPVAVVNGADDPIVDVQYLKRPEYSSLWYKRCHLIREGGHAPFLRQPKAFNRLMARFLRGAQGRYERALAAPATCFAG